MLIMQIIQAPSPKLAVSYDCDAKCVVYEKAEIIGIVQLENPEEPGDVQLVPCYLVSNRYGFFWVPELEYNFIMYAEINQVVNVGVDFIQARIKEIEATHKEIEDEHETVEVETKGKVTHIRRTIKRVKKEDGDDKK